MTADPGGGAGSGGLDMEELFRSTGAVGADMLAVDWAATGLGAPATWPQSLRSIVQVVLTSRFSMWMAWGDELTFICNDTYRRATLGTKYPWALGRPAASVWAEIWPEIGPRIANVLRTGVASWDESLLLLLERDGYPEETYHTFSYSPLSDERGEVRGMLCVVSEDTERVVGERRMAVLRRLGGALAAARTEDEVMGAASRELGSDLGVLPFAVLYLPDGTGGARPACVVGAAPGDPVAPAVTSTDRGPWPLAEVFAGREVLVEDLELRFREVPRGSWSEPALSALLLPLPGAAGGAPVGVLVAGLDRYRLLDDGERGFLSLVTRQLSASLANARAYESERLRAEELAALDRAKTAFFTNVSHEFRTPLTLILGPVADALHDRRDPLSPRQRARAESVHRAAERLLQLVNTLLDFSRLESGRGEVRREPTDLGTETSQLAEMFRSALEGAGLRLSVTCPPLRRSVEVDREMWAKVVSNLLSNAFKFTFDGGIHVRVEEGDDEVVLSVEDTGIGITRAEQARLFERFHRVEGARSRTFEGSGIGLALVAELVSLHGGTVGVTSEPGEGSVFTVRLPVGDAGAATAPPRTAAEVGARVVAPYVVEARHWSGGSTEPPPAAPGPGGDPQGAGADRPRVVVAEDNEDMRDYVCDLLAEDYDVVAVPDGAAALAVARRVGPDLVLADVMMPTLDGFGLVAALREDPVTAGIPVILLSARAGEESAVEGLDAGADDYLVKPFSAVELRARVRSSLERERVRRASSRREHEIAVELQRHLAPKRLLESALLDIATYYQPGVRGTVVGGDWYDAVGLGRARAGLVIGDVTGKGVGAAATMGQIRSMVRAYAGLDLPPAEVLGQVDQRVRELDRAVFATCLYAVMDGRSGTVEFANAGHVPPLVATGGTVRRLAEPLGPPLGAGPGPLRSGRVELDEGSTIVLYTDGLVETRRGDTDERIDRVAEIVATWGDDLEHLPAALVAALCPEGPDDDVAVLVARRAAPPGYPGVDVLLDRAPDAVAHARRAATDAVERWPSAPRLDDLVLVVSELVTNAVVHGAPPVRLRLTHLGAEVLVEVSDAAPALPRLLHPTATDEHGRGLHIVGGLVHRTGVAVEDRGKTLWCNLPVRPVREVRPSAAAGRVPSGAGGG